MSNCRFVFIILFWGFGPAQLSAQDVAVTSDKIRNLLETKNGRIAAAKAEVESSKEQEGSLSRSFLPSIEMFGSKQNSKAGSEAEVKSSDFGVEAIFNVFNGGRDALKDEIRSLETLRREIKAKRITADELSDARAIYWNLLYLREKVGLLKSAIETNKQNLNSAQRRIRSGVAANSDRFEFEIKETDLKSELALVEGELVTESNKFKVIIGLDDRAKLTFSEPFTHSHDDAAVSNPSASQYEFLVRERELLGRQQRLSASDYRRSLWPKLDLFAKYNKLSQRQDTGALGSQTKNRDDAQFGVSFSLDLADSLQLRREANALEKEAAAANMLSEYERREIGAHLAGEIAQLKILHDLVHEAEQNILRAERYYQITQSEYTRGVKNSPDVLGAAEKLFDIRHNRIKIIKDFQVAKSHILSKIGL